MSCTDEILAGRIVRAERQASGSPGTGLMPHGFAARSSKRPSILRQGSHDRAVTGG